LPHVGVFLVDHVLPVPDAEVLGHVAHKDDEQFWSKD
jgi:hypothetical protein